jgi:hypothetical protein
LIPETLKFLAAEENEQEIFLVTERVVPLSQLLEKVTQEEKVVGIYQIIVRILLR